MAGFWIVLQLRNDWLFGAGVGDERRCEHAKIDVAVRGSAGRDKGCANRAERLLVRHRAAGAFEHDAFGGGSGAPVDAELVRNGGELGGFDDDTAAGAGAGPRTRVALAPASSKRSERRTYWLSRLVNARSVAADAGEVAIRVANRMARICLAEVRQS